MSKAAPPIEYAYSAYQSSLLYHDPVCQPSIMTATKTQRT